MTALSNDWPPAPVELEFQPSHHTQRPGRVRVKQEYGLPSRDRSHDTGRDDARSRGEGYVARFGAHRRRSQKYMFGMQCPVGLLITPQRMWLYRDSYTARSPDSVKPVTEFDLKPLWDQPPVKGIALRRFRVALARRTGCAADQGAAGRNAGGIPGVRTARDHKRRVAGSPSALLPKADEAPAAPGS